MSQTKPKRTLRFFILVWYLILCSIALVYLAPAGLGPFFTAVIGVLLFGEAVPLWVGMQRWAGRMAPEVPRTAPAGKYQAASDKWSGPPKAGKGEEGEQLPSQPAGEKPPPTESGESSIPRPEPHDYLTLEFTHTKRIRARIPVENVETLSESDTDIQVRE